MHELPPGLATDLAVLELTGAVLDDRGDHVVVRTPANPDFNWGNCVYVTDVLTVADADRWMAVFHDAVPEAGWVAIALPRLPDDVSAWDRHGVEVELDEVLTTRTLPRLTPQPDGYAVRPLSGDDWDASIARAVAENNQTGEREPLSHERFVRRLVATRRALCERGDAAFFGAFDGERLVAELGIVRCGALARYQSVVTDDDHRGRGLASHLLGVAAQWAAAAGCEQWVIVTEANNPAGRIYRRSGFAPDAAHAEAYRAPARA